MDDESQLRAMVEVEEAERRAKITAVILKILALAIAITVSLAFLEENNDPRITFAVQGSAALFVAIGWWLNAHGRPRAAGWAISWMFWTIVCLSTWFFGGLKYEMGTSYIVAVMVAGATLGGRPAIFFAILSILSSTAVLRAELGGWLPEPIEPPSLINAWIAVTVSLFLGSFLLHLSLKSLHEAVELAYRRGRENEGVLQRLFQAEKMEPVGRLAGGIAHDFNNLLSVYSGGVSLLKMDDLDDASRSAILEDLEGATTRMAQMTGQLLAFSRSSEPAMVRIRVDRVVRELIPILSRLMGDAITVEFDAPDEIFKVAADRARMEQVLLNLAVNASEAMAAGGVLRFELSGTPDSVLLRVSDTGHGMDEDVRAEIFAPFFTTKPTGTGLGLATVHDVVLGIGGSIDVVSRPGEGTTFVIELPRVEGDEALASVAPAGPAKRHGGRVLLVEDHELVRRTNQRGLEAGGYEVTAVHDGAEALAIIESGASFDLVVSDVMMPRMTGLELAERLAEDGHRLPLLLVSGNASASAEQMGELPLRVQFLAKPFTQDRFLRAVADCLDSDGSPLEPSSPSLG